MTEGSTATTPVAVAAGGAIAQLAAESGRLEMCIHCGFCLDACPTYTRGGNESDSPRGRLYLMRAAAEGRIPPASDALRTHLGRCLGCRACEPVCPSGVEYGFLLERGRQVVAEASGTPPFERLLLATFGSPVLNSIAGWIARFLRASRIAAAAARFLPRGLRRARMAAAMLDASRPRPAGAIRAGDTGSTTAAAGPAVAGADPDPAGGSGRGRRVVVFEGCVQSTLFGRVNAATASVMEHNGHVVVRVPRLGCCGALHAHSGDLRGARALARRNLSAFSAFVAGEPGGVDSIVVNAAGCGAMMREYGGLFEGRPEAELAAAVAERVRDPLVLLAETGVRPGGPVPLRVAWDSPCHLVHGQRAGGAPLDVLRRSVPGLDVVPVPRADECCGGAGIHALVHAGRDGGVLADKLAAVRSVEADVVVTGNPGCMMQIGGGLIADGGALPVLHPVELMERSIRALGGDRPD